MESNKLNEFDQWIQGELNQFQPTPPPPPNWKQLPKGNAGVSHWYQTVVAKIAGGIMLSGALVYGGMQFMDQPNQQEPSQSNTIIQKIDQRNEDLPPITQQQETIVENNHVSSSTIQQQNGVLNPTLNERNVSEKQLSNGIILTNQINSNSDNRNEPLTNVKKDGENTTSNTYLMNGPDKVTINKWVDFSVSIPNNTLLNLAWDFDDGSGTLVTNKSNVRHQFENPGVYNVKVYKNSVELVGLKSIQVIVPDVNFDFSGMGKSMLFEASGADDIPGVVYTWNFGDGTKGTGKTIKHTFTNNVTSTYIVWLNVSVPGQEWIVSKDKKVQVEEQKLKLLIPNVFTPNGDGINDEFKVSGFTDVGFRMAIINAAGNEVFFTTNPEKGWDGTDASGKLCPEGNYFLIIHYQDESSQMQQEKSTIKLLKGN